MDLGFNDIIGAGSGSDSGGGSKKGGGTDANTLRARTRARMVYAVSEGVCKGLKDGAKSIYFDQTPLQNADGTYNFEGVIWQEHKGLPDEGYFNGFNAVETPVSVETEVKASTGPVQRTVVDANVDALRIIVRIPALVSRDSDSGAVKVASVSYAIDVRSAGGSWNQVVLNEIKNEKTLSPYPVAHRVPLPLNGAPWDVRVRRITADSDDENLQNKTFWEGYVELVEGKFIYPHTHAIAMEVDAENFGNSVPPVRFLDLGIEVQVPTNYNPETRVYTGVWNGTFKTAWTNNPAWVFYDLLTHKRYGLGEFIDTLNVDKWSLYAIAQYCDQLVGSGYKDESGDDILEPRYTFNGSINTRDEAFFVLQQVTTAWRGMAYWSLGQVFATADMPTDPSVIVSKANTVGDFNYSGTSLKARHSVIIVRWNDPNNFYRPATEVVINERMLKRYGWREKSLQLTGCTSRGLAHRYGKWALDTEEFENETVEWTASLDQIKIRPGDVVALADPKKASVRIGGRIKSHVGNQVTLDRAFDATPGETYSLMLVMPDGALETRAITAFAGATLTVAAFPATAQVDAMFAITGTDVTPRLFRVLVMSESEKNLFRITALSHDPDKYARVEQNVLFDPLPYTRKDNISNAPTALSVVESGYTLNGTTRTSLTVSWTPPTDTLAVRYRVSVETPTDGFISLGEVVGTSMDISDVEPGDYIFHVSSVGFGGIVSLAASITHTALGPSGMPLATVSNLRLADRPAVTSFIGRDVHLAWDNNFPSSATTGATGATPSAEVSPLYSYNTVTIHNGVTLLRTQRVLGETFDYTFEMNLADSLAAGFSTASRAVTVAVSVTDVYDRTSTTSTVTFTNSAPAAPTVSITQSGQTAYITWPAPTDLDHAGTLVWLEEAGGFNPLTTTPFYDGTGSVVSYFGLADTTYYVRVAHYDAFGKTGLNITTEANFVNGNLAGLIEADLSEIEGVLYGTGQGTLLDNINRLREAIEEVAVATISGSTVGHVRRLELAAQIGAAEANFLNQISVVADDVSALASDVTLLTSEFDANAAAVALSLSTLTTGQASNSALIAETAADFEGVSASGLFSMTATAAPAGFSVRLAAKVAGTVGGTSYDGGWYLDLKNDLTTRFAVKADSFTLLQSNGTALSTPFYVEAGVAYINNAYIKDLTADKLQVTSLESISATLGNVVVTGSLIVDGTLITAKMASNAITVGAIGINDADVDTTTDGNYTQLASCAITVPSSASGVLVQVQSTGRRDGNDCAPQFVIRANGVDIASFTGGFIFNNFGYSPKRMLTANSHIDTPPAGVVTYTLHGRAIDSGNYRVTKQSNNRIVLTLLKR